MKSLLKPIITHSITLYNNNEHLNLKFILRRLKWYVKKIIPKKLNIYKKNWISV